MNPLIFHPTQHCCMFLIDYSGKSFAKTTLISVVFTDIKVKVKEMAKATFSVREKFTGYAL